MKPSVIWDPVRLETNVPLVIGQLFIWIFPGQSRPNLFRRGAK